jgi:PAS domain S-box-containing protein
MSRFEFLELPKVPLLAVRSRLVRRVAVAFLVAIVAVQVVLLWPAYTAERDLLLDRLEHEVCVAVKTAIYRYSAEITAGNYEAASAAIASTTHTTSIMGGIVYDAEGEVILRFGEPLYFEASELNQTRTDLPGGRMEFYIPPTALDAPISIAVRADTSWIPSQTSAHLWRVLAIFLVTALVMSIVVTLIVTHMIVEPLGQLRASLMASGRDLTNASEFAPLRLGYGVLGDITRIIQQLLQRVSQTYREEIASFAAMVEQTGDAVFAYDSDGVLVYANKACLTFCGATSARELKGLGGPQFRLTPDDNPKSLSELIEGDSFSGEVELVFLDSKPMSCLMSASILKTNDGRVLRTFATLSDITEMRETQRAVEHKNKALEEANRIKAEFLAQMSHELRTPLNAIIGFSEILSARPQSDDDDDVYAFATDINNSGHHLLGLINDILDLSKLEAGKQELNEANMDLVDLAKSAYAMLRETARKNGVELICEFPEAPLEIICDAMRIKQVLLNLLSNAIKFTSHGGQVALSIRQTAEQINVSITDTGIGMKPEDIPKALQPFAQIDSGISRRFEGTGLGLPICSALVELHGGKMDIQSIYGEGTTVSFTIPISRAVSVAA